MERPNGASVLDILAALVAADSPCHRETPQLPESLAARIESVRRPWSLFAGDLDRDAVRVRLRRVATAPMLPSILTMRPAADRLPLIAGHGPTLAPWLDDIRRSRDRLFLIAPFRSALHLAGCDVLPDVIVLAERDVADVTASARQWSNTSETAKTGLASATLVTDAFAPIEIVKAFPQACGFDSGLGAGTPLPFHGSGVLSALALAIVLGHRRLAIAGVDRSSELLQLVASADDMQCLDLATALSSGPHFIRRHHRPWPSAPSSPLLKASLIAAQELDDLARVRADVENGIDLIASGNGGDVAAVRELVERVRLEWRSHLSVRTAAQRSDDRWLATLWELGAIAPIFPQRASMMLARLILPGLAAALDGFTNDCRSCLAELPVTAEAR